MLTLLSRFFLQVASFCRVWLDEGGDEEELVLARESSSDIPLLRGEESEPEERNQSGSARKNHGFKLVHSVQKSR